MPPDFGTNSLRAWPLRCAQRKTLAAPAPWRVFWQLCRGASSPSEAGRLCGEAARTLAAALVRQLDRDDVEPLAYGLASLATRMEPASAADVCSRAARRLIPYLERVPATTKFDGNYAPSAKWVSLIAARLNPAEAGPMLAAAIAKAENPDVRHELLLGLNSLTRRENTAEVARSYGSAAGALVAALGTATDVETQASLAQGLVLVAARLDDPDAANLQPGRAGAGRHFLSRDRRCRPAFRCGRTREDVAAVR